MINTTKNEVARLNNTIQRLNLFCEKNIFNENYRNRVHVATVNLIRAKIMLESIIEDEKHEHFS
jgi:hypothetical protein